MRLTPGGPNAHTSSEGVPTRTTTTGPALARDDQACWHGWSRHRVPRGTPVGRRCPHVLGEGCAALEPELGAVSGPCLVHRYYDPTTAQFLSVDPAVLRTVEPYSFANADPANLSDPTGLCGACALGEALTAGSGIAGSAAALPYAAARVTAAQESQSAI